MAEIVDDVKIRLDMSETDKVIALAEDNATMVQVLFQLHAALRKGSKPLFVCDFNDDMLDGLVGLIIDDIKMINNTKDDAEH